MNSTLINKMQNPSEMPYLFKTIQSRKVKREELLLLLRVNLIDFSSDPILDPISDPIFLIFLSTSQRALSSPPDLPGSDSIIN